MTGLIELRPVEPDDEQLLFRIYASTRAEELALVPWDDAQKAAFLHAQFDAQARWYAQHYAETGYDVVLVDGEPCGRLYVHRGAAEIRIVDIALLPTHRGRGVGTALLRDLLAEADATGKRVTIHVERFNPALRLYERLGFSVVEDKGVHLLMARPVLGEDGFVAVGGDRDEEELERAEPLVLDPMDPLRQRRLRTAAEDDRERHPTARLAGDLGDVDQLGVERRGVGRDDPEAVSEQRGEVGCGERLEAHPAIVQGARR
jgi:ribosomal protein S18 acetylase RimI-like enzyme